jgi:hypothetical protein
MYKYVIFHPLSSDNRKRAIKFSKYRPLVLLTGLILNINLELSWNDRDRNKINLLGDNPFLLPLCTPQIPSGMTDFCPFGILTFQVVIL